MKRAALALFALLLLFLCPAFAPEPSQQEPPIAPKPGGGPSPGFEDMAGGRDPAPLPDGGEETAKEGEQTLACRFYDSQLFAAQTEGAKAFGQTISAATVPHYAPCLSLLCDALLTGSESGPYELIVLLGPDHKGLGNGVTSSGTSWTTPSGVLEGDVSSLQALGRVKGLNLEEDDALLQEEHSLSTLIPYVKAYFPDSSVLPILLGKYTSPLRLELLADALYALSLERNMLLLCSIDFSHYEEPRSMDRHDRSTIQVIEDQDIPTLLNLGSESLDSPECMAVLLQYAKKKEQELSLLQHETTEYVENGRLQGASYMVWALE